MLENPLAELERLNSQIDRASRQVEQAIGKRDAYLEELKSQGFVDEKSAEKGLELKRRHLELLMQSLQVEGDSFISRYNKLAQDLGII